MAEQLKSITDARRTLPTLSQTAQKLMDRYIITRQGQPQSVLLGYKEYQGMLAALELLSRPEDLMNLRQGVKELRESKGLTFEEVQKNLAQARTSRKAAAAGPVEIEVTAVESAV